MSHDVSQCLKAEKEIARLKAENIKLKEDNQALFDRVHKLLSELTKDDLALVTAERDTEIKRARIAEAENANIHQSWVDSETVNESLRARCERMEKIINLAKNIVPWCMTTHGHIPNGWTEFVDALAHGQDLK
jgi:predicted RNase H-like nuclease (RuvC/YqgF family)